MMGKNRDDEKQGGSRNDTTLPTELGSVFVLDLVLQSSSQTEVTLVLPKERKEAEREDGEADREEDGAMAPRTETLEPDKDLWHAAHEVRSRGPRVVCKEDLAHGHAGIGLHAKVEARRLYCKTCRAKEDGAN